MGVWEGMAASEAKVGEEVFGVCNGRRSGGGVEGQLRGGGGGGGLGGGGA